MRILVLGHPRGGTAYAAALIRSCGLDVRHEAMGEHGIASWMFAVHDEQPPFTFDGSKRSDYEFDLTIHVARDPLDTIASTLYTEHGSAEFRSRYVNIFGNEHERAVLSYCGWHRLILAGHADIRCRIGELADRLRELELDPSDPGVVNAREHPPITMDELRRNCSGAVLHELEKMTEWYHGL